MTKLACELEKECILPLDVLKIKFKSSRLPIDWGLYLGTGLNMFTRACIKTLSNRTSSHWNQQLSSAPCDRGLRLEDSKSQSYCSRGAEVIFLLQRRLAEWRGKVSRRRPAVQHVQGLAVSSSACAAGPSQLGQHSRLSGQCQVLYTWVQ